MVKKYNVRFRPQAEADLIQLYQYISDNSGHALAGAYIDRIEAACKALETFPHRGTKRDDIRPGLRIIGFERRAALVFQVRKTEVVIVRILYGGRESAGLLLGSADK